MSGAAVDCVRTILKGKGNDRASEQDDTRARRNDDVSWNSYHDSSSVLRLVDVSTIQR